MKIIWYPRDGTDEFWVKLSVNDKVIVDAPLHYIVSHFAKQPELMFKNPRVEVYEHKSNQITKLTNGENKN